MSEIKAGIYSGVVSTVVCNPFDVYRTHKQLSLKTRFKLNYFYRGIIPGLFTIPTFWAIYFPCYKVLKENNYSLFSGYIACNIASTITCPLWFIRQKYQINNSFNIYSFYKKHGLYPFYNALLPTYLINCSFLIQMPVYEYLKSKLQNELIQNNINKNKISTLDIFTITSISKVLASCVFYPLDTIRTKRRNTSKSIINIIKNLNKTPSLYYSGLGIYLIRSIPYHASIFCTYEFIKKQN